jgi:hypothetical protein
MERRAHRLGKTVEQLLAEDGVALRQSCYPGPECLNPYEVERFFVDLSPDRAAHVEECPMCAALLDAAQPSEDAFAQFIRDAKAAEPEPSAEIAQNPVRRPLIDVLSVEIPALVAALGVLAAGFWVSDATLRSLLSTIAPRSAVTVFVVALLITLLTVAVAKWVKLGRGATFQGFGGAVTGGIFAALLVFYGGKVSLDVSSAYSSLETGQNALITALAERTRIGNVAGVTLANANAALRVSASPDGNRLSATSTKFDGKLIAQGQEDSTKIYWDRGERRRLGTIYQGTLEHGANGKVDVLIGSDKKVAVRPSLLEQALGTGTRVLALVPANATEASKIFPIDNTKKIPLMQPDAGHEY